MFIGVTEKIKSVPYKNMIIFLILLLGAGLVFKFGFMNILYRMNSKHVKKVETAQIPETIPAKTKVIEKIFHNNLFKIIGIVDDHYIVKTHKGLKKVKISDTDKKNINDEIKIEKL